MASLRPAPELQNGTSGGGEGGAAGWEEEQRTANWETKDQHKSEESDLMTSQKAVNVIRLSHQRKGQFRKNMIRWY